LCDPMDLFWDINLEEMLGDLVVTTFIILLAVSLAVVSLMVLLPLIDLAFEKKPAARPNNLLIAQDESWRAGRPGLLLKSNFLLQLMSDLPHAHRKHLKLVHDSDQFPEERHRTPLIKRATTGAQTELIIPDKGARLNRASTPSNAA
jgi:hypothetical protein